MLQRRLGEPLAHVCITLGYFAGKKINLYVSFLVLVIVGRVQTYTQSFALKSIYEYILHSYCLLY